TDPSVRQHDEVDAGEDDLSTVGFRDAGCGQHVGPPDERDGTRFEARQSVIDGARAPAVTLAAQRVAAWRPVSRPVQGCGLRAAAVKPPGPLVRVVAAACDG